MSMSKIYDGNAFPLAKKVPATDVAIEILLMTTPRKKNYNYPFKKVTSWRYQNG